MSIYKKIIIALSICACGAGAFYWFRSKPELNLKKRDPIPVEAFKAISGEILRKVTTVGTLSATQSVTLRPEVSGTIEKVLFEEGQDVKKGTPLYKIEDALYRAKVKEAEAEHIHAQGEYKRMVTLFDKNFGTTQSRDEALTRLKMSEAKIEESKFRLDKTVIRAPFEGMIGLNSISAGAFVSESVELVTLVDLTPINVDFTIPESFLSKVNVGDKVDVTVEASDIIPSEATIKAISPEVDESTRTVKIRAVMPNDNTLYRPGEFARVIVEAGKIDNAVLIPESAIEKRGDEEYVMVIAEGVAVEKVVSTGMRDGNNVEITDGIKAGDLVITAGQFKVRDGDEVKIVTPQAKK